jgi:hypothetical protein
VYFTIGGNIHGLVLGVVNDEASSVAECQSAALNNYNLNRNESDCSFDKVSCLFLDEFDQQVAELVRLLKLLEDHRPEHACFCSDSTATSKKLIKMQLKQSFSATSTCTATYQNLWHFSLMRLTITKLE